MPGDNVKINIDSLIESLPMIAPNLNGYKASFDFYFCPWSNYYGWMDSNSRDAQEQTLSSRWIYTTHPTSIEVRDIADFESAFRQRAVKPGSLMDMIGIPPGFLGVQTSPGVGETIFTPLEVPAEKLLSVLDIYRTYYANQQEGWVYFMSNVESGRSYDHLPFKVSIRDLDRLTLLLRGLNPDDDADIISALDAWDMVDRPEYTYGTFIRELLDMSQLYPLGGLPIRTYRMDLNRGLLKLTDPNLVSKVSVQDSAFTIDTLRFANKMQKFFDRIDISGGRFSDMMRARWGVTPRNTLNVPDYLGSVSNFFGITDVISTASGMNSDVDNGRGNSVLGQQAGFAVGKVKRENTPISFRADQYGTLVCLFSLVPIVTYSQGIEREDLKTTFADVFDPAFNQIGYQDVSSLELCALPQFETSDRAGINSSDYSLYSGVSGVVNVGRRFAWSEYMSSLPRAHGLFAYGQDFDYWVNNRLYQYPFITYGYNESDEEVQKAVSALAPYGKASYTTYIDPFLQNNLFADVSRHAQNFRLRVNFDVWMRRNVGSRVMPHL